MKTAIITGASRGIGKAVAIALSEKCDLLAICCHNNHTDLEQVASIIRNKNANCQVMTFTGDISDYNFTKSVVDTVLSATGSIDILINNAGISITGLFQDTTPDMWQDIIGTNLTSIYNTCHQVVPYMISKHAGTIINVSSVWGLVGASCEVAYSATKGGINSFTKALAKELAPSNISVNAVAFGAIDTEMNNHLEEDEKAMLCEEIPVGRMASPDEAAEFIIKLIDMPSYFTGEVVKFDGAWI